MKTNFFEVFPVISGFCLFKGDDKAGFALDRKLSDI
jgi:hypothetical protein